MRLQKSWRNSVEEDIYEKVLSESGAGWKKRRVEAGNQKSDPASQRKNDLKKGRLKLFSFCLLY